MCVFFFFKQKTAYEMRISDWSSDVCSSDLFNGARVGEFRQRAAAELDGKAAQPGGVNGVGLVGRNGAAGRGKVGEAVGEAQPVGKGPLLARLDRDRKSTRLNSSH